MCSSSTTTQRRFAMLPSAIMLLTSPMARSMVHTTTRARPRPAARLPPCSATTRKRSPRGAPGGESRRVSCAAFSSTSALYGSTKSARVVGVGGGAGAGAARPPRAGSLAAGGADAAVAPNGACSSRSAMHTSATSVLPPLVGAQYSSHRGRVKVAAAPPMASFTPTPGGGAFSSSTPAVPRQSACHGYSNRTPRVAYASAIRSGTPHAFSMCRSPIGRSVEKAAGAGVATRGASETV